MLPASLPHPFTAAFFAFLHSAEVIKEKQQRNRSKVEDIWSVGIWEMIGGPVETAIGDKPPLPVQTNTRSLHYPIWVSLVTKRRQIESALQPLWRASALSPPHSSTVIQQEYMKTQTQ